MESTLLNCKKIFTNPFSYLFKTHSYKQFGYFLLLFCLTGSFTSLKGQATCPSFNFNIMPDPSWQTITANHALGGWVLIRISLEENNHYTFKTGCGDGATADYDTYMELLDSDCILITQDDDGCEATRSSISYRAQKTGFYYIKVSGYDNTEFGSFTLAYKNTDSPCESYEESITPTAAWQSRTSSHDAFEKVTYKVDMEAGKHYTFKTGCGNGATSNYDTYMELYDADCNLIKYDDDGCEMGRSIITFSPNTTGTYYIGVMGFDSDYGTFSLAYSSSSESPCEPSDFVLHPTTDWQTISSSHGSGGSVIFKVTLTEQVAYQFKTGCGNGATADYDTYMELFDAGCRSILEDDDGCELTRSIISYTPTATGNYYVVVYGYDMFEFGSFILAYNASENSHAAEIQTSNKLTVYPNPTDGDLTFYLNNNSNFLALEIQSIEGRVIERETIANNSPVSVSHLRSGIYFYKVTDRNKTYTGKFMVQ